VWQRVALLSLGLVRSFSDVQTLNLGGGYKVARMGYEKETDLAAIGIPVREAFEQFASETGRQLKLEIEPGTYLVAKAGAYTPILVKNVFMIVRICHVRGMSLPVSAPCVLQVPL
jgi:diaminopimelate decarboxylase